LPTPEQCLRIAAALCVLSGAERVISQTPGETPARIDAAHVLDTTMVRTLVDTVASQIERLYVEADTAVRIANTLRARFKAGAYSRASDQNALSQLMTADLRSVNHDLHLGVSYASPAAQGGSMGAPSFLNREHHFALGRVDVLPGNIGYLEIAGFAIDTEAQAMLVDALRYLGSTDAIILDVRHNRGGSGQLSNFLISHFTGPDTIASLEVRSRSAGTNFIRYTLPSVPGPRRPDVPVYILTSRGTASAGEDFAFVMKNLKRATLVGDRTAGAGHNVTAVPSGYGFQTSISITRVSDPRTGKEWEQVGVQPDVRVDPSTALDIAQGLALQTLASKASGPRKEQLTFLRDTREAILHQHPVPEGKLDAYAGEYDGGRQVRANGGRLLYEVPSGAPADTLVALSDSVFAARSQARLTFMHDQHNGIELHIRTPDGVELVLERRTRDSRRSESPRAQDARRSVRDVD
jgi:hypothetical protein